MLSCLLLTLLPLLSPATTAPDDRLEGTWAGGFALPDEFVSLIVRIEGEGTEPTVGLELPERGFRFPAEVSRRGDALSWKIQFGELSGEADTTLADDTLRGHIEGQLVGGRTSFDLVRVQELSDLQQQRLVGVYRLEDGASFEVATYPRESDEVLALFGPEPGFVRILFPRTSTDFSWGPAPEQPLPVEGRLTFELGSSGEVTDAAWQHGDMSLSAQPDATQQPRHAPRSTQASWQLSSGETVEHQDVLIKSGDVSLAATLYLPPGFSPPYPAVVQLHGSAPTTRRMQWHYYTSICLRLGLAVLAYDKRGCGESTGAFPPFSVDGSEKVFDQLAGDAAAAHAWLLKQGQIDAARVGLIGGSQAGWVMPLVADQTEDVRFIISACGPPVSAGEEECHAQALQAGRSLDEADDAVERFDGKRGYDPRKLLRRLPTPTLWIFGSRDDVIPTRACLQEMGKLEREGHTQHTTSVLEDANHNFTDSRGRQVPLEPVLKKWLQEQKVLP